MRSRRRATRPPYNPRSPARITSTQVSSHAPPARFDDWRERVAAARVVVVGDVMLDRYWFGDVERISPEAPVPVVKIARADERPGGAANVARNVRALGAQATLLSVIGDDEAGRILARLITESGIAAVKANAPAAVIDDETRA